MEIKFIVEKLYEDLKCYYLLWFFFLEEGKEVKDCIDLKCIVICNCIRVIFWLFSIMVIVIGDCY